MFKERRIFTSESVTEGHPDKVADQISDAILDAILEKDPVAKVACEVAVTTGLVLVMGEITTETYVDIQKIVRDTVKEIGYDRGKYGFDADNLAVLVCIDEQSPDIARGVGDAEGAGDQGIMFGYACNETEEYMPLTITLAHKLAKRLADVRKSGQAKFLRPDGKTQVSIEYDDNNQPVRVHSVVVSTQHSEDVSYSKLRDFVINEVIKKVIPAHLIDEKTLIYVNPTGRFVLGGPRADSGLTGRKIIVDTYGGYGRHGGGAFSGKDPTKVDRSASYMARYIAKNIVASGITSACEIQLSYVIGVKEPISIAVSLDNPKAGVTSEEVIKVIRENFDLTPRGIIKTLNLRAPIYRQVAAYGHFGRNDLNLPWERLDKVDVFKKHFNL
ncbi:MAG TPA: methionine adenosyltransferase [Bacilli bacterium]|nr:methionine adenosyltransferase [Bacilli bacterium]HQA20043.1 methionine adenosyltransferase [Bacilli bacterium]HQD92355.1 methionine adenosyltransferase [Bacilli bacterium]